MGNQSTKLDLGRMRRKSSAMSAAPPLAATDLELLVSRTQLSSEEVREHYHKFCSASHGSNTITRDVFSGIMHKCFPRTYKAELESDIFALYDVNGNGYIEFTEFLLIVTIMSEGTAKEKLQEIFKIFDSDKNGTISFEELLTIVTHLFHLVPDKHRENLPTPQAFSLKLLEEMDTDKDGVISEDEFVLAFLRNELLTTNVVNKIMTRFASAKTCILED